MPATSEPIIHVRDLSFAYQHEPVLEDVHLCVPAGDFLAVIGPNGSGKTTLLKLLLGVLTPQQGIVRVFGRPPGDAANEVGYVPQQIKVTPGFPITVLQVVLLGLLQGRSPGWRFTAAQRERACQALAQVEMLELRNRCVADLSGGQLQRVIIARALVGGPRLLLLDEPTANIDPHGRFCFFQFLARLNETITIVIVSHDIHIVTSRVKSVACVNRLVQYSPRAELTPEMLSLMYGEHSDTCIGGVSVGGLSAWLSGMGGEDGHA